MKGENLRKWSRIHITVGRQHPYHKRGKDYKQQIEKTDSSHNHTHYHKQFFLFPLSDGLVNVRFESIGYRRIKY